MAVYRRPARVAVGTLLSGMTQQDLKSIVFVEDEAGGTDRAPPAVSETQAPDVVKASDRKETPSLREVLVGIGSLFIGVIGGLLIHSDVTFNPADGIGAFAVFYVIALAIERLLEFFDAPVEGALTWRGGRQTKSTLKKERDEAIAAAANHPNAPNAPNPADAQAKVNKATKGRSVAIAGLSGGLGIIAAAYLNADFLGAIGVKGEPRWLTLAITGLVVAGGSKQLHDLITNVSKASDAKSTPEETTGSASS